ncbi:hypothetical protein [Bacillus sp. FJAT-27251]|uniref:hypothetical protein n=1 Tax=Bacillus sp. FJAT-27251 TaxID=1684142 RepID=UPI0006A77AD6|nr:hypothetical protein [Bacillus sp. FJAT-27251]
MVKSKKSFYTGILLLMLSIGFSFPFPHIYPYSESLFSVNNITITTEDGWHLPGVISLVMLVSGLVLLSRSLNKYQGRAVLTAFLFTAIAPSLMIVLFQKTIATGIYAVAYDRYRSECTFETISASALRAECELPFKNHSREHVEFSINFYERYRFEDEIPMISLLNHNAPYYVSLPAKGEKVIKIQTEIKRAQMKEPFDSGQATEISLMIQQGKRVRKL